MSNLQKVVLGTPPKGDDGDTVRFANVKANANVDVLNAQATLSSAKDTITAPQALTVADHLGKRVNIALAADGAVSPPPASKCAADSVILVRNIGTTVVSLPASVDSGDTVALSKLNPGETALIDTDGIHAWTVLMRGRTNGDNETVNGNCAVVGDETVGGSLTVSKDSTFKKALAVVGPLTATGGLILPDGTSLATAVPAPVGQCRLVLSGNTLLLSRLNGAFLTIAGIARLIPAAGVSLAPTGLVAGAVYFVYAYLNSGVMTLVCDTAGHTADSSGVQVKTGDPTKTLVGMVYLANAGTFVSCAYATYFNRRGIMGIISGSGSGQVPTIWAATGGLTWGDESITLLCSGFGSTPASGNTSVIYFQLDGAPVGQAIQYSNVQGGYAFPISLSAVATPSEGYHSYVIWGRNDGQMLTMSVQMSITTRG
jgi:hypothetical protein